MGDHEHNYFCSSKFSDLKIHYGHYAEREFLGHRVIMCNESAWFRNACEGEFLEATTREVTLHDDDPTCITLMLEFCYRREYGLDSSTPNTPEEELFQANRHLGMIEVGDKYFIPRLINCASEKLRQLISSSNTMTSLNHTVEAMYENEYVDCKPLRDFLVQHVVSIWMGNTPKANFKVDISPMWEKYPVFGKEVLKLAMDKGVLIEKGLVWS